VETILQRLTELEDVYDAILVGKDGLIVSGILHSDDEEVINLTRFNVTSLVTLFLASNIKV
jgi:predicted regulator of Ras-like GTPase activity (Roadblock/LC7/MglB family)